MNIGTWWAHKLINFADRHQHMIKLCNLCGLICHPGNVIEKKGLLHQCDSDLVTKAFTTSGGHKNKAILLINKCFTSLMLQWPKTSITKYNNICQFKIIQFLQLVVCESSRCIFIWPGVPCFMENWWTRTLSWITPVGLQKNCILVL